MTLSVVGAAWAADNFPEGFSGFYSDGSLIPASDVIGLTEAEWIAANLPATGCTRADIDPNPGSLTSITLALNTYLVTGYEFNDDESQITLEYNEDAVAFDNTDFTNPYIFNLNPIDSNLGGVVWYRDNLVAGLDSITLGEGAAPQNCDVAVTAERSRLRTDGRLHITEATEVAGGTFLRITGHYDFGLDDLDNIEDSVAAYINLDTLEITNIS